MDSPQLERVHRTRDQNIHIQSRVWGFSEKATVGYMYDYGNESNTGNHNFNSDVYCKTICGLIKAHSCKYRSVSQKKIVYIWIHQRLLVNVLAASVYIQ